MPVFTSVPIKLLSSIYTVYGAVPVHVWIVYAPGSKKASMQNYDLSRLTCEQIFLAKALQIYSERVDNSDQIRNMATS